MKARKHGENIPDGNDTQAAVSSNNSLKSNSTILGWWTPSGKSGLNDFELLKEDIFRIREPLYIVRKDNAYKVAKKGKVVLGECEPQPGALPVLAFIPPCPLENLGDQDFCRDYQIQYPYIAGSMAHCISSIEMVERCVNKGMLAFIGAAGLPVSEIELKIDELSERLDSKPYGFCLINSPNEPDLEANTADLYIRKGVRVVEASAYINVTLPLVRYRVNGIHSDPSGNIITPNRIIAKVSRREVASRFFSPPPEHVLKELVQSGEITEEQARLAGMIPLSQDLTAEADSGGHTDKRTAITLFPTMLSLRDKHQDKYRFSQKLRVGLAGGVSTPVSAAAAFSMGAAYILSGSVNQSCIESGTSSIVRKMLAETRQGDLAMAHAADMFEMGVQVQVLKRGTMFAMRSKKLFDVYNAYESISDIPLAMREKLEKDFFKISFDEIWARTREYFRKRDSSQIAFAEHNPKRKMSLIFRWYLSQTSHWAISGDVSRQIDYQIWCGPSMAAFNEWVKGTFLEPFQNRKVVCVALNILYGAAVLMRCNILRIQNVQAINELSPVPLEEPVLEKYL